MAYKFKRNNGDCLYWIYPLIILVILIFAILRDNKNRDSAELPDTDIILDSSLTINSKDGRADSIKMTEYNDSILKFYATTK